METLTDQAEGSEATHEHNVGDGDAWADDLISFGPFTLDRAELTLRRHQRRCRIQPQPLRVLILLLARAGRLVTRDELRREIWGEDYSVDHEHGLNFAINQIRTVLGDTARAPRFIETVPREGYRFIATVERQERQESLADTSWASPEAVDDQARPDDDEANETERSLLTSTLAALAALRTRHSGLIATLLVTLALLLAALGWQVWRTAPPATPPDPSEPMRLALIPFEAIGVESAMAHGMSLDLIGALGRLAPRHLAVIGHRSMAQFRGTSSPASEIGRRLNAAWIVEGQIRQVDDQLQVDVMIIDAADDSVRWSESYRRTAGEISEMQQDIAARIARQLLPRASVLPAAAKALPVDPTAYRRYAEARWKLASGRAEGRRQAIVDLREVVREAPSFAPGKAALAVVLAQSAFGASQEKVAEAFAVAEEARTLDPRSSDAQLAVGLLQAYAHWDLETGSRTLALALELDPNNALALAAQAGLAAILGDSTMAAQMSDLAVKLDPLAGDAWVDAGYADYLNQRFEVAKTRCERSLELGTTHQSWAALCFLNASQKAGDLMAANRAVDHLQSHTEPSEKIPADLPPLERIRHLRLQLIDRLERYNQDSSLDYLIAIHSAEIGLFDQAIGHLARARDRHDLFLPIAVVDPSFDPLRSDPRFQETLSGIEFHAVSFPPTL